MTSTAKWEIATRCEVYSRSQQKWVKGEVVDVFTDDDGEWVLVKYGRKPNEMHPGDRDLRKCSVKDALTWQHVVAAIKHELYPMMAASMEKCIDNLSASDLSEKAVDGVMDKLKKTRALGNKEAQYIRNLVARARTFSWEAQPQTS